MTKPIKLSTFILCQKVRRKLPAGGQGWTWHVVGHAEDEIRAKIWKGTDQKRHFKQVVVEFVP